MRPLVIAILSAGLLAATAVHADTAAELAAVRAALIANAKDLDIASLAPTPIPSVYEVVANQEVIYVDRSGRYAFLAGRLVDIATHRDLTQPTLDRLSQIDFAALPKELAIKRVNGNGRRELAVFADPACPICRRLDAEFSSLPDATIYIYTLPIISPESTPASIAVWCAQPSQRLARWESFMAGEPAPTSAVPPACGKAKETVAKLAALGERYQIQNTPTLVLPDSRRIVGAMPIKELDASLNAAYIGGGQ